MQGFARQKGLQFGLQFNFPLPQHFCIDPTRLKQILLNLCNNAIKFTDEGRVDLQVYLDASRKRFIFVISDTGPGLSDKQQLRLFSAFSQGDQSTNRKYGGTGLGLYISKQLTEMMNGHIKVTSQLGQGSQFAVYLPWIEALEQGMLRDQAQVEILLSHTKKDELKVPQLRARILCADDNEDNRRLITYLLHKTGAQLSLVENGLQALETALSEHFDLILMDMQMPEMDGLEATSLLKQGGFSQPIIMLTANVDGASKQQIREAGADGHFAKPIDTLSFYQMLSQWLEHDSKPGDEPDNASSVNSPEYEKLIADYRQGLGTKLERINQALACDDWSSLKQDMHKMKGSAGSFGFNLLSEIASEAETCIVQQELEAATVHINKIGELITQLATAEA
jgi:CheY-like chemotaxis protein/HPt (histidine-containing phosphotransfer) domain-containing protein/anti-sigma regulatory factor (Ser/Thr protein kinase)